MAKFRIEAVHFVEAPNWDTAEEIVESGLSCPDEITSHPATREVRDIISFGLAKKIAACHQKIYFDNLEEKEYTIAVEKLKEETLIYVRGVLEDLIQSNENLWE